MRGGEAGHLDEAAVLGGGPAGQTLWDPRQIRTRGRFPRLERLQPTSKHRPLDYFSLLDLDPASLPSPASLLGLNTNIGRLAALKTFLAGAVQWLCLF